MAILHTFAVYENFTNWQLPDSRAYNTGRNGCWYISLWYGLGRCQ